MAGSAAVHARKARTIFSVLKEWDRAQVYQKTIALFTQRLQQGQ